VLSKKVEPVPFKIGVVSSLTGPGLGYGQRSLIGIRYKVEEEINKSGGINGHPIKLMTYDTGTRADQSAMLVERAAVADKVVGILGPDSSSDIEGCIINIASVCGHEPYSMGGAYSSSKAGMLMFTQQLALEFSKYNIRVNSISPGFTLTPMTEKTFANKEIYEKRVQFVPLHRIGEPEDIARVTLFLASEDASYIHGTDILVEGGITKMAFEMIPGRTGGK
jgi:NAD(P)-dependent dehydrogenase (short-subunit alcohol dehydrogenase family)